MGLERFDAEPPKNPWGLRELDRTALLVTLVNARLDIGAKCPLRNLLAHTERKGRPFTLVCTKTTASYERACKTFERDQRNLSRLVGIEKELGQHGGTRP